MEHFSAALIVKKTAITPPCLVSGRVVQGRQQTGQVPLAGVVSHQHPVAQPAHRTVDIRASNKGSRSLCEDFTITEKAPTKTLLRHYGARVLTHCK